MRCPSTGPERSLLVHPSQSHLSPRTSYRLAAAAKTQGREGKTARLHRESKISVCTSPAAKDDVCKLLLFRSSGDGKQTSGNTFC